MYMCNYGGDNPCNVFEAKDAEYLIASNCGVGETGKSFFPPRFTVI